MTVRGVKATARILRATQSELAGFHGSTAETDYNRPITRTHLLHGISIGAR